MHEIDIKKLMAAPNSVRKYETPQLRDSQIQREMPKQVPRMDVVCLGFLMDAESPLIQELNDVSAF